ncbi:MAG: hypothetical protein A2V70_00715 [Planctomycetes bacterium RBG_13_63_9]|nr:MAG: hypothetical protein A2V70_00715 [Planctomycetes bacterium RBG_13_63_9]
MERIPNLERRKPGPPPALMVPTGTRNVALNKPVASSDNDPILGHVEAITDGAKEYNDPCVELQKGLQYVTIDLEAPYEIHAIALWHYHLRPRAYFDVIVQITNDPECQTEVTTVFNNDHDNSSGRGAGSDTHYIDTCWGRVIPVNRVQGRYVRLYSNGNDETEWNIYLEVEVYGRPVDRG